MTKDTRARSLVIPLVVAQLWLSAVAGDAETVPSQPIADPYLQCVERLAVDPLYRDIAAKLPLRDMSSITFSMLADQTRPTPRERDEIADWFDRREECAKASESLHRSQWPPELFQLAIEGSATAKAIGVDLYRRKITYGEANRQIEQLVNATKAKMIPIVKQYQAELAAQKVEADRKREFDAQLASQRQAQYQAQARADAAQDQAIRLQRAQIFMNYMQAQQQQLRNQQMQMLAPRQTYSTNCYTAGNNTNCTTH